MQQTVLSVKPTAAAAALSTGLRRTCLMDYVCSHVQPLMNGSSTTQACVKITALAAWHKPMAAKTAQAQLSQQVSTAGLSAMGDCADGVFHELQLIISRA